MKFNPHDYQTKAIDFAITHSKCGLFLPMGAGKTSITLTVMANLIQSGDIHKILIIAPVRVAQNTWPDEIEKWEHTKDLTYQVLTGTPAQRLKKLNTPADIYLIGKENVTWLVDNCKFDFDLVVVDELSTFKNPQSQRFKALKKVTPKVKRFIGLTGTPAPKGIPDLWSQIYLIDSGQRLGRTLGQFRQEFLLPALQVGFTVYSWKPQPDAEKRIEQKISDVCMSLKQSDCAELPPVNFIDVPIQLPAKVLKQYKTFKKELVVQLGDESITAVNAGVLCGQLLQMSSGEIYTKDLLGNLTGTQVVHDEKIKTLEDLIDGANSEPMIIYYYFKHERERIIKLLEAKKLKYSELKNHEEQQEWNNHNIDVLLLHPASAGHGLNLQKGGSIIIWYTLPNFNLEYYQQANARLYRQGQSEKVRIYRLIAKGTIDEQVLKSLDEKNVVQSAIIDALLH